MPRHRPAQSPYPARRLDLDDSRPKAQQYGEDEGDMPDAATIDRSGNAAANRLEAVIARIARREGDPHERRERARRIRRDILLARRIRGGPAPALPQAWGGSVD